MECVLTVSEQKNAVVALVGSVSEDIRALILKHIDQIWCAAQQHACEYPMTLLYAQREAIDFALAKLAPYVNQKRGKTDAVRTADGITKHVSDAVTTQRGSGFSCDWSNTGSYASNQSNSDSWNIGRSASDSSSQSLYYSHSWDRGRTRDDAQSQSAYERRSDTSRRTESQDFSVTNSAGSGSERTVGTGAIPHAQLDAAVLPITVAIPPLDITIPGINIFWPKGPSVEVARMEAEYRNVAPCGTEPRGCALVPGRGEFARCNINSYGEYSEPSSCDTVSYSTSSELVTQITIPIPFVGAFTFAGTWGRSYEARPRCGSSRSTSYQTGFANASSWMRGRVVADGSSRSESSGTRQNDAHTRATGSSSSSNFARSIGDAYTIAIGESHSGSDTNSHGESQTQDLGNSRAKSRGFGTHKTVSDREHEFDIRAYSDAFRALADLRAKVGAQIEEMVKAIGKQLYAKGRVRKTDMLCATNPRNLARGLAAANNICCAPAAGGSAKQCYVNSMV